MSNDSTPLFHFDPELYPQAPGCFLIRDATGRALLAGGTVNLRRRLAQIFEESILPPPRARVSNRLDDRLPRLAARAHDIEVFLLPDNGDCPALANSLIERYHPLFNLATYLEPSGASYITLTAEDFPRLISGRLDASPSTSSPHPPSPITHHSFGPYPSHPRDLLLKSVTEAFGLRTCHPLPRKACLSYQIKLCSAPCEGRISKEEYAARVAQAAEHLSAPGRALIDLLQAQAQAAREAQEFQRARRIDGQVRALKPALVKLAAARRAAHASDHDQDAIYIARGQAFVVCLRRGAIRDMQMLPAPGNDAPVFLREQYSKDCPPELILNEVLPGDPAVLSAELSAASGHPVTITVSASGPARDLLEIARINHVYRLKEACR